MIEEALRIVVAELDQSLRLRTRGPAGTVVLSGVVDAQGNAVVEATDKLAAFLVNVEREDVPTRVARPVDTGGDRLALQQPPVHLNLLVMFAATFSGATYDEALKLIARTIGFFQARPVFTRSNTPDLPAGIDRLSLEIENLNLTDLSNLWGILGGRYLPSVLYRLRLLTIDAQRLEGQPARVGTVAVDVAPTLVPA